jgi:hypothetical protein
MSDSTAIYFPSHRSAVSGGGPCVDGPGKGFGYYGGTLYPGFTCATTAEAIRAAAMCNEAYQQGYISAQREIRQALGIKEPK